MSQNRDMRKEPGSNLNPLDYLDRDPPHVVVKSVTYMDGRGLFAAKPFPKGYFVINYRGIEDPDVATNSYTYDFQYSSQIVSCIDASAEDSGYGRFINDCDPYRNANCVPKVVEYQQKDGTTGATIALFACVPISAGK